MAYITDNNMAMIEELVKNKPSVTTKSFETIEDGFTPTYGANYMGVTRVPNMQKPKETVTDWYEISDEFATTFNNLQIIKKKEDKDSKTDYNIYIANRQMCDCCAFYKKPRFTKTKSKTNVK